jgi:threonylcarbamoyladenosine tRNA methylthiotransferase MtaB
MARRCKTEEFAKIVEQMRHQIEGFNITTDIIVGFPGETEEEWQESVDFIKAVGFGHIHIFTYSSREGTKAATLPHQVTNEIKKQRSKQLHVLADEMKQQFMSQQLGKECAVLWEGQNKVIDEEHLVFGYTPNYLKVACRVSQATNIEKKIINAKLNSIVDHHMTGTLMGL